MDELKACPFCGGVAKITGHFNGGTGNSWEVVECTQCGMTQPVTKYYSHQQATIAWNRRTQPENKPLSLEELRQMDGKPVWIKIFGKPDLDCWGFHDEDGVNGYTCFPHDDDYGKTWLAYVHKPEQASHQNVYDTSKFNQPKEEK